MVGLARGTVKLCEHEKEWELQARNTISRLKQIWGHVIKDIQHVGSTSIPSIKAKPIIDIVAAVDNFDDVLRFEKELKAAGFHYQRPGLCQRPAAVRLRQLLRGHWQLANAFHPCCPHKQHGLAQLHKF